MRLALASGIPVREWRNEDWRIVATALDLLSDSRSTVTAESPRMSG